MISGTCCPAHPDLDNLLDPLSLSCPILIPLPATLLQWEALPWEGPLTSWFWEFLAESNSAPPVLVVILWFSCPLVCQMLPWSLSCSSHRHRILADLGAGGALSTLACLLGVVRVCYLVLLSMSLCCCFNVRTEKLCCNQHLPWILPMCLHTGGMLWITYVTANNVVKSTIFLKL